jgi:GT2 family glycosyltransferase
MNRTDIPLVSLIIVDWNSGEYLPRCLESLCLQTFQDFEVIIVDNGSNDHSATNLNQRYPVLQLQVNRLEKNVGFAAGNNIGASLARGKWLVLLNADAFPEQNWLQELVLASQSHPEMISFSSRQLQDTNPKVLDGAGDAYHVSGFAWRIGIGYPASQYGLVPAEIFSPCAAAAMYLRQAFLDVGGFDEDFFSYFEDVDLGFRMQLRGYRCLYVPTAIVYHVGSATFGVRSTFALYHTHRNMIWTYFRNMPYPLFWLYLPAHLLLNMIYVLYYTVLGRGKVIWQAKYHAVKDLARVVQKRQERMTLQSVDIKRLQQMMEHGWLKPYLRSYHLRRAWRKVNH